MSEGFQFFRFKFGLYLEFMSHTISSYALTVKIVHHYLVISSEEWDIQIVAGSLSSYPGMQKLTSVSIGQAVLKAFSEIQNKMEGLEKNKLPRPKVPGSRNQLTLKIGDAARILGVSPGTVRRLTQRGRLKQTVTPGGHRRYSLDDLRTFLENQSSSLPLK